MSDIVLLRARRLDLNRAIIFHVLVLAADLCGSIIFRNDCRHADARSWVLITIAFGVIPVLIAGTTTVRIFPFLVSAANLSACLSAAIVFADRMLLSQFPTFTLLYLGLSLAYTYVLHLARSIEHENIRMSREQENIMKYFYFTPRQWENIRAGSMDSSVFDESLRRMERNDRERRLLKFRSDSAESRRIRDSVLSRHPRLTSADTELCRLIVQGYSASDISRILGLKLQSVTSRRSRLRTKLGLQAGQNLNEYLRSIAGNGSKKTRAP